MFQMKKTPAMLKLRYIADEILHVILDFQGTLQDYKNNRDRRKLKQGYVVFKFNSDKCLQVLDEARDWTDSPGIILYMENKFERDIKKCLASAQIYLRRVFERNRSRKPRGKYVQIASPLAIASK